MQDTPEAVQNFYQTLLLRRSVSERVHMGCAMFDTARTFARASLRGHTGNEAALRVHLFVRTYGGDFDAETVERMSAWLSMPHRARQEGNAGWLLLQGADVCGQCPDSFARKQPDCSSFPCAQLPGNHRQQLSCVVPVCGQHCLDCR